MATPYVTRIERTVHSTQDYARVEYEAHADGMPILAMAHAQRAGRGRQGRHWWSAPRALLASVALASPRQEVLTLVPLLAGIAAHDAIAEELGIETALKWPNDVLMGQVKVGGVLSEVAGGVLVVGCGINVWWPDPPDGAGALVDVDPGEQLTIALGHGWAKRVVDGIAGLPETFHRTRYTELCDTIGRSITWVPDGAGKAVGVGPDGALIVETAGGKRTLFSNEVSHVRRATIPPNAD